MSRNFFSPVFRYWPLKRHGAWIAIRSGVMTAISGNIGAARTYPAFAVFSPQPRGPKKMLRVSKAGEGFFPLLRGVPFSHPDPYSVVLELANLPDRERTWVRWMKAQLARFVLSLIAMLLGLVAWMEMDTGWIPAALVVIVGFGISEVVYRRLADPETIRSDLEERVRNQHL